MCVARNVLSCSLPTLYAAQISTPVDGKSNMECEEYQSCAGGRVLNCLYDGGHRCVIACFFNVFIFRGSPTCLLLF